MSVLSNVELFLEHGINLDTRAISIDPSTESEDADNFNEVNTRVAIQTVKKIHFLDNYKQGPITIFINSPGGCVTSGFAIYDAIRACKNYVRGYVYGTASSMGSIILQACDERIISEHSFVMIHDGTIEYPQDSYENIELHQKETKRINELCYDIYMEKIREAQPKFRKQDLKRYMKNDMFFYGQKAIDFGLADRLVVRGE